MQGTKCKSAKKINCFFFGNDCKTELVAQSIKPCDIQ